MKKYFLMLCSVATIIFSAVAPACSSKDDDENTKKQSDEITDVSTSWKGVIPASGSEDLILNFTASTKWKLI